MEDNDIIEKIKNLTPKEFVLSMVNGLRKRHTKIDMTTYGFKVLIIGEEGVCFGCAATNTLCELGLSPQKLPSIDSRRVGFSVNFDEKNELFILEFESIVDKFRKGFQSQHSLIHFNDLWLVGDFTHLKFPVTDINEELPPLDDDYTDEDLNIYERFANLQG